MKQRYGLSTEAASSPELREGFVASTVLAGEAETVAEVETDQTETTALEVLTTLLRQEAQSRRKETWVSMAWSAAFTAPMLWLLHQAGTTEASLKSGLLLCFSLMSATACGLVERICRHASARKASLTAALSRLGNRRDPTQVGPLLRTLQVQATPVRNLAKHALIALLPTLHASDSSLLTGADRKILLRQLAIFPNDPGYRDLRELFSRSAYRREIDLRLAILKAMEQVGGEQEVAAVERLARDLPTVHSNFKVPDEIREAAKACLPYLQARAEDQRAGAQLLRASGLPFASGADLLRPAASASSTPPEQLLRAGDSSARS